MIKTIATLSAVPANQIRADQCGDWGFNESDGRIMAFTAHLDDPRSELAVAIHELIEAWMCREAGVTDEQVTMFDFKYERERAEGKHDLLDEAGDDERAPYREQHEAATIVERAVCFVLKLHWKQHELNISRLYETNPTQESNATNTQESEPQTTGAKTDGD